MEEEARNASNKTAFYEKHTKNVILEPYKFCEHFKSIKFSHFGFSEEGFKLEMQDDGGWAMISPRGKLIKRRAAPTKEGSFRINYFLIVHVLDLVYIQKHRSFFTCEQKKEEIWKISLSDIEPKLWKTGVEMEISAFGRIMRETLNGKALAILKSNSEVTLVEILEDGSGGRTVTSDLWCQLLGYIEIGGQHGDILIALDTGKKELLSCTIKDDLTVKVIQRFDLSAEIDDDDDNTTTLAISPCAEYVFVHTSNSSDKAAKQLMLHVKGDISLGGSLDLSLENLDYFNDCLAYSKTVGDEMIFKGIPWIFFGESSRVVTFLYNKKTREFKELKNHRIIVEGGCFYKLIRHRNNLYEFGFLNCRLLKIS